MTAELGGILARLAREIGSEDRKLAILGEGNVSARLSEEAFLVKASGSSLAVLEPQNLTACRFDQILPLLDRHPLSDEETEQALWRARLEAEAGKPSTETVFHAWLLGLPGVQFVGHCHPTSVNQVLCSEQAERFAAHRLFPDEVVCCGARSVFVPYADPGVPLARAIREQTRRFIEAEGWTPRLILLRNHGLIALGATPNAVLACILMAAKAAEIFVGAAALGGPVFMPETEVRRIRCRPDEAYRQRQLRI